MSISGESRVGWYHVGNPLDEADPPKLRIYDNAMESGQMKARNKRCLLDFYPSNYVRRR
jgi:hypothetical protein